MASFMQIYIGNLSVMTTSHQLANLFLPFGSVRLSRIVCDKKTGRSLGFGFVEMDTKSAKTAIRRLNRFLFMNSYMEVKEV
jgi:RNA recognition motif-containing protein